MKFYVSIFNHLEGENKLFCIQANNLVDACKKALIQHCPKKYRDQDYLNWVNTGETYEEVCLNAAQGELVLSNVIETK